ncbi:MAG: RHS repeat-associated core domain-containing protein, partial [Acidobacteriota bacterium]
YAPSLGRFLTPDPAGVGLNHYAYVDGDPINFGDPFGFAACSVRGGEFVCSVDVTRRLQGMGLAIGGGGLSNSIGPNALEQDIPFVVQVYLGNGVPSDERIARALRDLVKDKTITECEGLGLYIGEVALRDSATGANAGGRALFDAMKFLTPASWAGSLIQSALPEFGQTNTTFRLGYTGAPSGYRDNLTQGHEDQTHHFAFFFQLSYLLGSSSPASIPGPQTFILPILAEFVQGTPGNLNDMRLGVEAMRIGSDMRAGRLSLSNAAAAVMTSVCK